MRTAIGIGSAYASGTDWDALTEYVVEADRLGVDDVWSAEAWGTDAVTPLAYLAARTERIRLGTGIMQISARAPSMTAMTAMSLASMSNDRFVLGLGVSGPQVVEGLHGTAFAKPLGRLREYVDILKIALSGEKIAYDGEHYTLPRPGGEGKAIRMSQPPRPQLPIYLATLGPKSLEFTGEVADGWLGTSFIPEHGDAFFPAMRAGAERAGRSLDDIDIQVGGEVEFGDDLERMAARRKPAMAFTLGAMGSARTNFYNDAYRRAGFVEAAREVQALWLARKRDEAAARVPDEMVLGNTLIGDEARIRDRIRAYRDAGVTTLRLSPAGATVPERLDTLGRVLELIRQEAP